MNINSNPISANTLIKQPTDNALYVGQTGVLEMTEKWKGQYEYCVDVADNMYSTGYKTYDDFIVQHKLEYYTKPTAPTGTKWFLKEARVEELEAGIHGMLTMQWQAMDEKYAGGQLSDVVWQNTWDLQWEQERYDAYAYCANPENHISGDSGQLSSQRSAIEASLNLPMNLTNLKTKGMFMDSLGLLQTLNGNEKAILKKKLEGKGPMLSYPVVTYQEQAVGVLSAQVQAIITSDRVKLPETIHTSLETPFHLNDYEWLCKGTTVLMTYTDKDAAHCNVIFRTKYIGAYKRTSSSTPIDRDFYGPNAWELGAR